MANSKMAWSYEATVLIAVMAAYCLIMEGQGFIKISPYLHSCKKTSPELNTCIKDALSTLITNLKTGSPELSIPTLDPLIIPHVESDFEDGGFRLFESFDNVFIFGLSVMKINTVRVSLEQNKLEITSKIPILSFQGHYKSDGQVINFPLASAGAFEVNLTDVTSMWIVYFKKNSVNGTKYLKVEDMSLDMVPLSVNIDVAEQLNAENTVEQENLNSVLNESSSELFIHFKPKLVATLGEVFSKLANNVLAQYPEDVILPEN